MYNWDYTDEIHLEQYKQFAEENYFSVLPLRPIILKEATLLPYMPIPNSVHAGGGIVDAEGKYVEESAQHIVGKDMDMIYSAEKCNRSEKKVMWFGVFHKHWGHFLTEMISRCWYLLEHQPDEEDFYVVYSIKKDTSSEGMTGTYKEFLSLLGVPEERLLLVMEPTIFPEIIIPPLSCEPGKWYAKEYQHIFDYLITKAGKKENVCDKVYLTRLGSRSLSSTQIGEKQIQKAFKKNDYKIISPELLNLQEQIQILSSCNKLVVIEGTLMHNLLFCKEQTDITIINRVVGANAYQPLINQAKAAHITYLDAHLSFFPVFAGGPFLFYLNENFLAYAEKHKMIYPKSGEGIIRLHMKLIWYFLYYLESMTGETIDTWKLVQKHQTGVLEQYRFYRYQLTDYNKNTVCRIRKALTLIMKGLFNL